MKNKKLLVTSKSNEGQTDLETGEVLGIENNACPSKKKKIKDLHIR